MSYYNSKRRYKVLDITNQVTRVGTVRESWRHFKDFKKHCLDLSDDDHDVYIISTKEPFHAVFLFKESIGIPLSGLMLLDIECLRYNEDIGMVEYPNNREYFKYVDDYHILIRKLRYFDLKRTEELVYGKKPLNFVFINLLKKLTGEEIANFLEKNKTEYYRELIKKFYNIPLFSYKDKDLKEYFLKQIIKIDYNLFEKKLVKILNKLTPDEKMSLIKMMVKKEAKVKFIGDFKDFLKTEIF